MEEDGWISRSRAANPGGCWRIVGHVMPISYIPHTTRLGLSKPLSSTLPSNPLTSPNPTHRHKHIQPRHHTTSPLRAQNTTHHQQHQRPHKPVSPLPSPVPPTTQRNNATTTQHHHLLTSPPSLVPVRLGTESRSVRSVRSVLVQYPRSRIYYTPHYTYTPSARGARGTAWRAYIDGLAPPCTSPD